MTLGHLGRRVILVLQGQLVAQVIKENLEMMVQPARTVLSVHKVQQDKEVLQECQAIVGKEACLVCQAQLVNLANKD